MSSSCHSLFRAILKLPIVVEAFKPHVGSSSTSIEQQLPVDVVVACSQQLEPKAANKCFICRMKVGLTGFKCSARIRSVASIGTQKNMSVLLISRVLDAMPLLRQTLLLKLIRGRGSKGGGLLLNERVSSFYFFPS
ncbi:hypothetical protein ES332_D09G034000v1 [Gossypium tomentosum]|uniref:Uncharacterized protein n=1 Tax=Gossypium tomentosum TaxID=34277 RepID=A0A5D2JDM2_GOSTO|nr:hypothetical protein ES332_D09G034000v1 [Gossypium tomentosum]